MSEVKLIAITKPVIDECETAEELLAYCARVSNPNNQDNHDTAGKLLKYCANNAHWSIFETASMTVEIKCTRDIGRQILRHRSCKFQEFSQRYAEVTDDSFELSEARLQDKKNRQSSIETHEKWLQNWWTLNQARVRDLSVEVYKEALAHGIAKEVARKVLPEGLTKTTMYLTGDIRSFIHYCNLRCDDATQKEHRVIAQEIKVILLEQFPSLTTLFV
jgi:thymidylate synthase (FAD)